MAREPKDDKDQAIAELSAQIEELKAQLADMVAPAKRKGADLADDLKDEAEGMADAARRKARRTWRDAGEQAGQLRDRASSYAAEADVALREHPATAMGIAVGLGFLLGLVLARR